MAFTQKSIQSHIAAFTTDGDLGKEKPDSWKAVRLHCFSPSEMIALYLIIKLIGRLKRPLLSKNEKKNQVLLGFFSILSDVIFQLKKKKNDKQNTKKTEVH